MPGPRRRLKGIAAHGFTVKIDEDGWPGVAKNMSGLLPGAPSKVPTTCPLCFSPVSADIAVTQKGGHYLTCGVCTTRVFTYSQRGSKILHAWHLLLQDPEVRTYMIALVGSQADRV